MVGLSSPYLLSTLPIRHSPQTPIVRGRIYRFRYRAQNCIGWGPFSPELLALAADAPQPPPAPSAHSISASSVTLLVYPVTDNGGAAVTDYEIWRNSAAGSTTFTKIASYSFATHGFQHSIGVVAEGMTPGGFYQFQVRALNVVGWSAYSEIVTVPVADPPAPPALAPQLVSASKTSLTVKWSRATDTQTPAGEITGHYLYMDDGLNGAFTQVLSGAGAPTALQFTATRPAIQTGREYRFYLVSENRVGLSTAASPIAAFRACQAPTGLAPPTRVRTTTTSVEVAWTSPTDDGGCRVSSYHLFVALEAPTLTFAEVHSAAIPGDPSRNRFTVTELPAGAVPGSALRLKLQVDNLGGYNTMSSGSLRVLLATAPNAPTAPVARDAGGTSASTIKVTYTPPPSDGGSPITTYEVQMDDGVGGGFHTVAGGTGSAYLRQYFIAQSGQTGCTYVAPCTQSLTSFGLDGTQYTTLITSLGISKGSTYRFRFRAANAIGFGDWSPVASI